MLQYGVLPVCEDQKYWLFVVRTGVPGSPVTKLFW